MPKITVGEAIDIAVDHGFSRVEAYKIVAEYLLEHHPEAVE